MFFTILICKLARFVGSLIGRGSSLPGTIALKLDKNILSKLTLPERTIAVTGSNGKTSVTELIRTTAEAAGLNVVCNSFGSNQIEGVTTALLSACDLRGRVKADAVVLESDERFCQYTFAQFAPKYMVVTNLYRDQLTRNGHSGFVLKELGKGVPESTTLIANADDPVSATLANGRADTLWFGVDAPELVERSDRRHAYDDGAYCPLCKQPMEYSERIYSHLGSYHCPSCGYSRQKPRHSVTDFSDGAFVVDGEYRIHPQLANRMFAYNIAAAFTACVDGLGLDPKTVATALDGHCLMNGRVESFDINGHKGLFMLSKHENSMAYNGALDTIMDSAADEISVVIIVDLLSRKYVANDMSWLWDIDFELLANDRVKKVFVGGLFANDVATRLLFAGVPLERLVVSGDIDEMMAALYADPVGDIFALTCFTDEQKFRRRLKNGTEA